MVITIILWAVIAVILFAIELFTLSLFFLFASFGAFIVINLVAFSILEPTSYLYQAITFLAATLIIFLVLLKPLMKLRKKRYNSNEYNDVIGQTAIVNEKNLTKNELGYVKWNGTLMLARIDKNSKEVIEVGKTVKIVSVDGNILIVREND